MTPTIKKYIHKELIFVIREEDKLVGIKVKGYQGDINILSDAFQDNVKNVETIKQIAVNNGAVLDSIERYEEVVNKV